MRYTVLGMALYLLSTVLSPARIPAVVLLFDDHATEVTKVGLLWQSKRRQYEPFIKLRLFGGLPYTLRVVMQFFVFFVQMSVLYLLPAYDMAVESGYRS